MVRFAVPRMAAACLISWCVSATCVSAQALETAQAPESRTIRAAIAEANLPSTAAEQHAVAVFPTAPERPGALVPLYVSFGVLQVLDSHSTTRALQRGAVEANPVMKGIAGNPAGMLAVKGAGTAGVIYVTEKMWKKNRAAAVVFMVATSSAMAWVVHRNYEVR